MAADTRWIGVADASVLAHTACQRILKAAQSAISERGRFLLVLTGGSTPGDVYRQLVSAQADWSRWQFYFGDERCLPRADSERNSRMAAEAWLDHVPIAREQIHLMPAEAGASAGATQYAAVLRGVDAFDLVLLGLGEDGHTASLFPGHDWGLAPDAQDAMAVFDSPKPPPERVTLSGARLCRTREMLFLVTGKSKQDAVTRWRAGERLPAAALKPACGVDVLVTADLLAPAQRES